MCGCIIFSPPTPLAILPTSFPAAIQNEEFLVRFQTADGSRDVAWSICDGVIPSGMSLDSETGVFSGRPLTPGVFTFFVCARERSLFGRNTSAGYTWTVIPKLSISSTLPPGRVGEAYSAVIVATGGVPPYQLSLVGLPAGLSFDANTGQISGVPAVESSAIQLEAAATDSGNPRQNVTQRITLSIKPVPIDISTTSLPPAVASRLYSTNLIAAGGLTPFRWAVVDGLLPQGLSLDTRSGVISGLPPFVGNSTFTVQVTDADSPATTDTQTYTLQVNAQ